MKEENMTSKQIASALNNQIKPSDARPIANSFNELDAVIKELGSLIYDLETKLVPVRALSENNVDSGEGAKNVEFHGSSVRSALDDATRQIAYLYDRVAMLLREVEV
jgi:hypothetical protein